MESRAILAERPVHPLLAFFPLGLFAASLVMDLIRVFSLDGNWSITSYYMIGAGVIGALLAAVFGFVDWMSIPVPTRAKSMGMWRLLARVAVAGLFAASWMFRRPTPADPPMEALLLSAMAVVLAVVPGWLGGAVENRADVDSVVGGSIHRRAA